MYLVTYEVPYAGATVVRCTTLNEVRETIRARCEADREMTYDDFDVYEVAQEIGVHSLMAEG